MAETAPGGSSGEPTEPASEDDPQHSAPFQPPDETVTEANRLMRALGLPEQPRDETGRRPAQPAAPSTAAAPPPPARPDPAAPAPGLGSPKSVSAPPAPARPAGRTGTGPRPGGFPGADRPVPPPAEASRLAGSTQQIQVAPPNPDGSTRRTRAEPPPAPEPARRRGGLRRTRVRRTHRTVRHVDPWSVFKVSILLYACLYVAVMLAGVLLWAAAYRSGLVDNLESFIAEVGSYAVWEIDGQVIFERARIIGLVMASAGVAFSVLMAIIFNLVSDLVGGIRLTILEEEPPEDG